MEDKYDFTTSYFVKSQSLYLYSIDKIATSLNIEKSVGKETKFGGGIGHASMSNGNDSLRGSLMDTQP